MALINKIEYKPEDMPADYDPDAHWEEVSVFECHPDFSDKAWHFRGYVIAAFQPWMGARPDIYVPESEGHVRIRETFVAQRDWARLRDQARRDITRRRPR